MEDKSNELKIELYPDRKPRYDFTKEPLENIIPKDALAYSFDKKEKLAFIKFNTPVLNGFYKAHTNHYPIRIKPDDIWLLIVQSFSYHVNENAQKLRNMFVNFSGKKELTVNYPIFSINDVNNKILENFSEQINDQMKQYLGESILNTLTPNFSTTTYDYSIVCKISIMGAFKKYFDYTMNLFGCGVPYLILEGTAEDYQKIISKAKELSKYKFEWYINKIIPHIEKMVEAKQGKIDVGYFKNMVQSKEETEHKSGPSGMGAYDYKVDHLSGWFLNFFSYITNGFGGYHPFKGDYLSVLDFKKLPNQRLTVPFKIIDANQKVHLMKYKVGFIGCNQNEKNEVYPVTGWIVSPNTKEEEDDDKENPVDDSSVRVVKSYNPFHHRQGDDDEESDEDWD